MLHLGALEIGFILLIIVIIFGVGKLPQAAEGIGKGIRSFRRALAGDDEYSNNQKGRKSIISSKQKCLREQR